MTDQKGKLQQYILTLAELRRLFDQYARSADVLDGKAKDLLAASSLVAGLFALLPLASGPRWFIALIVASYLALVIACVSALSPKRFRNTVSEKWEVLSEYVWEKPLPNAYEVLIANYGKAIAHNEKINQRKARMVQIASVLLAVLTFEALCYSIFFTH